MTSDELNKTIARTTMNEAIAKFMGIEVKVDVDSQCRVTSPSTDVCPHGLYIGDVYDPCSNLTQAMELALRRCMDIKIHQITVVVYPQPDQPVTGEIANYRNKRECLAHTICRAAFKA